MKSYVWSLLISPIQESNNNRWWLLFYLIFNSRILKRRRLDEPRQPWSARWHWPRWEDHLWPTVFATFPFGLKPMSIWGRYRWRFLFKQLRHLPPPRSLYKSSFAISFEVCKATSVSISCYFPQGIHLPYVA